MSVHESFGDFVSAATNDAVLALRGKKEWIKRNVACSTARNNLISAIGSEFDNLLSEYEDNRNLRDGFELDECYIAGFLAGIGLSHTAAQPFLKLEA